MTSTVFRTLALPFTSSLTTPLLPGTKHGIPMFDLQTASLGPYMSSVVGSTYARLTNKTTRYGDPICDAVGVVQFSNRYIIGVADGCGWGEESLISARCALAGFFDYVYDNLEKAKSLKDTIILIFGGFDEAQHKISELKGSTTLIGGILFPIVNSEKEYGVRSENEKKKNKHLKKGVKKRQNELKKNAETAKSSELTRKHNLTRSNDSNPNDVLTLTKLSANEKPHSMSTSVDSLFNHPSTSPSFAVEESSPNFLTHSGSSASSPSFNMSSRKWCFACVSIGDCKAYLVRRDPQTLMVIEVKEITDFARTNSTQPTEAEIIQRATMKARQRATMNSPPFSPIRTMLKQKFSRHSFLSQFSPAEREKERVRMTSPRKVLSSEPVPRMNDVSSHSHSSASCSPLNERKRNSSHSRPHIVIKTSFDSKFINIQNSTEKSDKEWQDKQLLSRIMNNNSNHIDQNESLGVTKTMRSVSTGALGDSDNNSVNETVHEDSQKSSNKKLDNPTEIIHPSPTITNSESETIQTTDSEKPKSIVEVSSISDSDHSLAFSTSNSNSPKPVQTQTHIPFHSHSQVENSSRYLLPGNAASVHTRTAHPKKTSTQHSPNSLPSPTPIDNQTATDLPSRLLDSLDEIPTGNVILDYFCHIESPTKTKHSHVYVLNDANDYQKDDTVRETYTPSVGAFGKKSDSKGFMTTEAKSNSFSEANSSIQMITMPCSNSFSSTQSTKDSKSFTDSMSNSSAKSEIVSPHRADSKQVSPLYLRSKAHSLKQSEIIKNNVIVTDPLRSIDSNTFPHKQKSQRKHSLVDKQIEVNENISLNTLSKSVEGRLYENDNLESFKSVSSNRSLSEQRKRKPKKEKKENKSEKESENEKLKSLRKEQEKSKESPKPGNSSVSYQEINGLTMKSKPREDLRTTISSSSSLPQLNMGTRSPQKQKVDSKLSQITDIDKYVDDDQTVIQTREEKEAEFSKFLGLSELSTIDENQSPSPDDDLNEGLNLSDCGGRLGPNLDTRNLNSFYTECNEGDVILVVSDGVHDNLDPELLGMRPADFGVEYDKWEQMPSDSFADVKQACEALVLVRALGNAITPEEMCFKLRQYCESVTRKSREYMEHTNGSRVPSNYELYPGKMDHFSIVCVQASSSDPFAEPFDVPNGYNINDWPSVELSAFHPNTELRSKVFQRASMNPETVFPFLREFESKQLQKLLKETEKQKSINSKSQKDQGNENEKERKEKEMDLDSEMLKEKKANEVSSFNKKRDPSPHQFVEQRTKTHKKRTRRSHSSSVSEGSVHEQPAIGTLKEHRENRSHEGRTRRLSAADLIANIDENPSIGPSEKDEK